jgi:threonine dehydrogenase-like Zn-dependent dehydrogenase
MKAVRWHGKRDVRVDSVPDPSIQQPNDAIIRVTSTAICGSDLHLYEVLGMYMTEGDILGHEPIGTVEEVGPEVRQLKPGDRVVIPFNIACGRCFFCDRMLYSQCETTQVAEHGKGAALFGYTMLYGSVPGAQAEYLRVPQAHFGPIVVPAGTADDRFLYLSDVLPTAWQAVAYADVPKGGSLAVFGLGPVGQMCVRVARQQGVENIFGIDLVAERLETASRYGATTLNVEHHDDVAASVRDLTHGRGADAVIDAVGLEAHGSPAAATAQAMAGLLPDKLAQWLNERAGIDRMGALLTAIETVRRGGTLSIVGVYGGAADPMPMMKLFDKQIQVRMGQANVKRWVDDIMPLLLDDADPLGTESFATDRLSLDEAPEAYAEFQKKEGGSLKVVLRP